MEKEKRTGQNETGYTSEKKAVNSWYYSKDTYARLPFIFFVALRKKREMLREQTLASLFENDRQAHMDSFIKELRELRLKNLTVDPTYKRFTVEKRTLQKNGKPKRRVIHAPNPSLKILQKQLKSLLSRYFQPHKCSYAYDGKSFADFIRPRRGCSKFVSMDLKNFFPSITSEHLSDIFLPMFKGLTDRYELLIWINKVCLHKGKMVQGSCTSPVLSNLVMRTFDANMLALTEGRGYVYARYSDDFYVAQIGSKEYLDKGDILDMVDASLPNNIYLNHQKTRFHSRATDSDLGVGHTSFTSADTFNISTDISYTKKEIKRLSASVYSIKKYGLESHFEYIRKRVNEESSEEGKEEIWRSYNIGKSQTYESYVQVLMGKVNHLALYANKMKYNKLLVDAKFVLGELLSGYSTDEVSANRSVQTGKRKLLKGELIQYLRTGLE